MLAGEGSRAGAARGRLAGLSAVAAIVVLAVAIRLLPGGDLPFPDDGPYHLIRVERILSGGPPAPDMVDPLLAHPHGAIACWPWGFDWLLAAFAAPFVAAGGLTAGMAACQALIPLLAALTVVLLFRLARAALTPGRALLAAAVLAVLPAHVQYTLDARPDHHVVEPLFLLLGTLAPVRRLSGARASALAIAASGAASGLSLAFAPASFPIAVIVFAASGTGLALAHPEDVLAYAAAAVAGAAAALVASPAPFEWVFYSPSLLHVAGVATVAAGLVATARLRRVAGPGAALAGGLLASLLVVTVLAVFTGPRQAVLDAFRYFGPGFSSLSFEASPLSADPMRASSLLGWLVPLAIAGVVVLARRGLAGATLAATAVGTFALAVVQRRFLVAACPLYALAVAEGAGLLGRLASRGLARAGVRPSVRGAAGALAIVAGLVPSAGESVSLEPLQPGDRLAFRAADIVAATPPAPGRGGVLSPWQYGHLFQWRARRPTVCDNFFGAPAHDEALRACFRVLLERDPGRACATLADLGVDVVVVVPPHPEEVRLVAALAGLDPSLLVSDSGVLTAAFRDTLWARLGLGAARAPSAPGPCGLWLVDHRVARDAMTSEPVAEMAVFALR